MPPPLSQCCNCPGFYRGSPLFFLRFYDCTVLSWSCNKVGVALVLALTLCVDYYPCWWFFDDILAGYDWLLLCFGCVIVIYLAAILILELHGWKRLKRNWRMNWSVERVIRDGFIAGKKCNWKYDKESSDSAYSETASGHIFHYSVVYSCILFDARCIHKGAAHVLRANELSFRHSYEKMKPVDKSFEEHVI